MNNMKTKLTDILPTPPPEWLKDANDKEIERFLREAKIELYAYLFRLGSYNLEEMVKIVNNEVQEYLKKIKE